MLFDAPSEADHAPQGIRLAVAVFRHRLTSQTPPLAIGVRAVPMTLPEIRAAPQCHRIPFSRVAVAEKTDFSAEPFYLFDAMRSKRKLPPTPCLAQPSARLRANGAIRLLPGKGGFRPGKRWIEYSRACRAATSKCPVVARGVPDSLRHAGGRQRSIDRRPKVVERQCAKV
jgi:hypothetical protein